MLNVKKNESDSCETHQEKKIKIEKKDEILISRSSDHASLKI